MTYIAGLQTDGGIVLCADTQESHGDEIVYVEKIESHDCGQYKIALAGAGRTELIDGFIAAVTEAVRKADPSGADALKGCVASCLAEFYRNDVRLFPGKQKGISFLIAATRATGEEPQFWRTSGMRVLDVARKAIIGYRAPFAGYIFNRLYKDSLALNRAVLVSTYVVAIAKDSGVSVGGETQIVIVTPNGIFRQHEDRTKDMLERLLDYEQKTNRVFLECADTSVPHEQLERTLAEFSKVALSLHKHYRGAIVSQVAVLVVADANPRDEAKPSDVQKSEPGP